MKRRNSFFFQKFSSRTILPPSHQYITTKASNVVFVLRRKVPLCQSGGMADTPRTVPSNVPIDRITPGYCQVVFQFSIINLTSHIIKRNLSTPPQLTAGHKWQRTTFHCLPTFSQNLHHDYLRHLSIKFLLALAD